MINRKGIIQNRTNVKETSRFYVIAYNAVLQGYHLHPDFKKKAHILRY